MPRRKKLTAEQIIGKLREAEVEAARGCLRWYGSLASRSRPTTAGSRSTMVQPSRATPARDQCGPEYPAVLTTRRGKEIGGRGGTQ